jgi:hypothetical protein
MVVMARLLDRRRGRLVLLFGKARRIAQADRRRHRTKRRCRGLTEVDVKGGIMSRSIVNRIAALLRWTCMSLLLGLIAAPALAQSGRSGPVCSQPHYIKPSELMGIAGAYDLSNGDVLYVSKESRQFYAEMSKTGRMEIIPLNPNEFAEKGGPVRLTFDRDWPWVDVKIAGLDEPRTGEPRCRPESTIH